MTVESPRQIAEDRVVGVRGDTLDDELAGRDPDG